METYDAHKLPNTQYIFDIAMFSKVIIFLSRGNSRLPILREYYHHRYCHHFTVRHFDNWNFT